VSGAVYESVRAMVPAGAAQGQRDMALRGKAGETSIYSIRL